MDFLRAVLAFLTWPLALAALAAGAAAHGGRFSARLDALTHFAPLYLMAAVAALVLSLGTPRGGRAALATVALLAVAANAALMAPEFLNRATGPTPDPSARTLKLIQFNAWGSNPTPDVAVDWLMSQNADIIVLEEAPKLRDRLLARGVYQVNCMSCGAVIFSRQRPVATYAEPAREGHPSYLSSATFQDEAGPYTVVGVHRYWPVRFVKTRVQTQALHEYLAGLPKARMILAGDFNSTPWSFARRREDQDLGLLRRTRGLWSWPAARLSHNRLPAPFPYLPIDHVYAGAGWATVKVERGPGRLGSDHYPVVITLARAPTAD